MYSFTPSLTSELDELGGQCHVPAVLPPGKTLYPLCRRLDGLQGRSGGVGENLLLPGFDPRTVQRVANLCTNWANPAELEVTWSLSAVSNVTRNQAAVSYCVTVDQWERQLQSLSAEFRFRSGICGWQAETGTGFSPSTSAFPYQCLSTSAQYCTIHLSPAQYNLKKRSFT